MRTFGSRWVLLAALTATLVVACPHVGRAEGLPVGKPGADYVPEETLLLLELPDVSATVERLKENALVKVYNDPGVQQYLQPLLQKAQGGKAKADQKLTEVAGLTVADIAKLLNGRITLALTGFSLGGGQPSAKAALMLAPKDTEHLKATIAKLLALMPADMQEQIVKRQAYGADISEIQIPGFPVAWTVAGNAFLLTVGPQAADEILMRMAGEPARSLSGDMNYRAVAEKVAPYNQDWNCYMSFDRPVRLIRALAPLTVGRVMDYLGLEGIKAVGMAAKCNGPAIDDIMYVYAPGESRLMAALVPKPVDPALLKGIPAAADSAGVSQFDLAAIYALVMGTLEQSMALQDHQEMQEQIQAFEQQIGISLKDDLINAFGGQWGVYNFPIDEAAVIAKMKAAVDLEAKQMAIMEGTYSNLVVVNVPRDGARLAKGLKAALGFSMQMLKQEAINDPKLQAITLEDITVGGAAGQVLKGLPDVQGIQPCYVITDKYFLIAGAPEALNKAVAALGGADITTSELYKNASAYIPEGAGAFTLSNPTSGLDMAGSSIQNTLQTFAQLGVQNPLLNVFAMMDPQPVADALKKHMFVPVLAAKGEGNSLVLVAHSPYGGVSTMSVAGVAIGAGLGIPAVFQAREVARDAVRMRDMPAMPMPQ